MSYRLEMDDMSEYYYGKMFSESKKDKDALFVLDNEGYSLTVLNHKDEEIELCKNFLGDNEIKLDDFVKDPSIVNFNKVIKIESGAFPNLSNSNENIVFKFKSESVEIMPNAFGNSFEKLGGIEGLEGQLAVMLYYDSFTNEGALNNVKFKNTDVYLEGEWTKAEIKKLLEAEYDNGKIRNGSEFEIEGDLFTDEELDDSKLNKLNKELADKISLDKESTNTKKENISKKKEDKAKAKAEAKDRGEEVIEELTWNKVDEATQEKIIDEMIEEFNRLGVFARIELDEDEVDLTDSGEIIIVKDSINKVSFIGNVVEATKKVFERDHEDTGGKVIRLKNNKANKDKARDMAKNMIEDYFEENRTVLEEGDLKGLGDIACKFVIDVEELKKSDKFKDREINLGDNVEQIKINEVSDLSSAKRVFDRAKKLLKNGKDEAYLTKKSYGELLNGTQLVASIYKNTEEGKEVLEQCKKLVQALKKSKIK